MWNGTLESRLKDSLEWLTASGVGDPKIHQLFTNQIHLPRRLSQDTLKLNFKLGLLQLRTQRAGREKKNVRFVS